MFSQHDTIVASPWISNPKPNPTARLRLFCFPYAGGGASIFSQWVKLLPPEIELCSVQLPGRENRWREQPYREFSTLVKVLAEVVQPYLDKPFAFFGHSLGALLAYETARQLRRYYAPEPEYLFVSGRRSPQLSSPEASLHQLPNQAFIQQVQQRYNGIPALILQDRELMELFLPILRADFELLGSYRYEKDAPLKCALTAFGGWDDRQATQLDLAAWRSQTCNSFNLKMFPGDHFYMQSARPALVEALAQHLSPYSTKLC